MVTLKLFNVRFNPRWKTTFRRCCESLSPLLLILIIYLLPAFSLNAQNDAPCDCVQRWEGGAHWNEDGTIDDSPNAPAPLGVIRCANAAETQSQIKPNDCVYNPAAFSIDVSGSTCIDPSTGETVTVANPTEGEPIIWLNFDVRPHASDFEVQINDNSGDKIGFALYYSTSPTSGVNENGISGDCSDLVLVACGVESSNTWNTLAVPDFDQPTNYYLAIWDQDADGDLKLNNFKARFGCSDVEETPDCNLDLIECPETAKVSCGDAFDPETLGLPFDPENCSDIEINYKDVIGGICGGEITITRFWTFKDQTGNSATCEQLIEFVDESAPIIEEIEDYVLENCDAEWPSLSTEWSDNCGAGGQVDGVPGEIVIDGCTESRTYTFTVSDECGNETSTTTTVTRKLDELVVACPGDKTVEACASQADIDAAFSAFLEAFKIESGCNASGTLDAEYSAPEKCGGSVEVSYTATSDCGEPQTCTATFTVPECKTGECGVCPESCLISGDQLVCPGELVSYKVAVEDACENAQVIWSLNETYNDATIVGEDPTTNSVVLKIDNNCDAWVELIATIKCEGCEDVVCKYPIDVVLTELTVDSPEDVVISACTSQEEIDAAFEAFLDAFSFAGGCGARGDFDDTYSAPDKCGGNIEVHYTVTESCGDKQIRSATFTIEECEDESCKECPEGCLISGKQLVCPGEEATYTMDVDAVCENPQITWSLQEGSDAEIVGQEGNAVTLKMNDDCEGWLVLKGTLSCEGCEDIVCTYMVDVGVPDDLKAICPENVDLAGCLDQSAIDAAFADFLASFTFEGGCNAQGHFAEDYSAPSRCGGVVEVVYIVEEACGGNRTCMAAFSVDICTDSSCNDCPEDCLISGKQLVCPGMEATYTMDVDAVCENPQITWSLQEGSDAEIIGQEGNSVTLKMNEDCEGWLVLIGTLNCEGCEEDVVCNYMVDVGVPDDLKVICPENVDLAGCLDQATIDAAFADFLASFTFEGGCNAQGHFSEDYSAPTRCGGVTEVVYIVEEACGGNRTCMAAFSVDLCTDGSCNLCEGTCLIEGAIAACPNEELVYTLALDGTCSDSKVVWTLDGDAEMTAADEGSVTVKTTDNCEGWFTLKAKIFCDNCPTVYCEKTVDVVRHKLVVECPQDLTIEACQSTEEIDAAFADFLAAFDFSGGCGDGTADFVEKYSAPDKCGGSVSVTYRAIDNCGQAESCTATFTVPECPSCYECQESCAISGKQLVCPGAEATYTMDVEAACENPQITWSLQEGSDAEIIGKEGNSVTLKMNDDCEGWLVLIGTLSCEGCEEDVVCTYMVDVGVPDDLKVICPENVDLSGCLDQATIDAAFADFLASFSFEGGCNAQGRFAEDYSAPTRCGGVTEVVYIVEEACGGNRTCMAAFSVDLCTDGSCNLCEGSCLIEGDIAACPNEELLYTLALDGTCTTPKVIWTIDGDAEITATGDGTVTVKANEDCEGWFTLKAEIFCDNCPTVYCEKTVDIVRHKLILECPDDVRVGACLSSDEINAAFEEFLNSFSYSGGCGGTADFDMDYTAPESCGKSVTVKYIATDGCGQSEYCTATFTIADCEKYCTPEIKDLEDIILEGCGAEWPTLETQWWDDCGGDGKVLGVPGEVMTIDDCYQYRIYTFTIYNDCGENAETTTKVTRRFDLTPPVIPIPQLGIGEVKCIEEVPTPEGLQELIAGIITDNCDDAAGIRVKVTTDGTPECVDGSFSFTFYVQVCDECGNCDEVEITYGGSCTGEPGESRTFCTLTPGGWGNPGGKYPWGEDDKASTLDIITALMDANGPITIGDTLANVLRITNPACVLALLPGGGSPGVLPEGDVTASGANDCMPYAEEYFTNNGRLKNTLANHAITLQLNIWYSLGYSGDELGDLSLSALSLSGTDILPDSVSTVGKLLQYINLYLGGSIEASQELSGSLTELAAAVNEFFDGCSEITVNVCDTDDGQEEQKEPEMPQEEIRVWPNPASKHLTMDYTSRSTTNATFRIFDPNGKVVYEKEVTTIEGVNRLVVPIDEFPAGIYTVLTIQGDKHLLERIVIGRR